jgi:hypothetical protein
MKTIKPEKVCFPIYRDRFLHDKWFPIGWSFNVHDLGLFTDPPNAHGEWGNGTLEYIIDNGIWWFNTMYTIPFTNHEAWGEPIQRVKSQWTTTDTYIRLLDYCKSKREETNGKIDIKPMVWLTNNAPDFKLRSAGTWDTIPNDNLKIFHERINILGNHDMLGAWVLSDEPFGGDKSRVNKKREHVVNQLRFLNHEIFENDPRISQHMIFNVIRGDGNFHFPDPNKPSIPLLDDLNGIGDYIIDDLYLYDFIMAVKLDKNYMGWAKTRTENAVKNITEIIKTTPTYKDRINKYPKEFPPIRDGFMCLVQGTVFTDIINPTRPDLGGEMSEDQLRYQLYTQWVNGAQGAMFWNLSKSNLRMFNIVKKLSYEAFKCSNYLMNPPDDICNDFDVIVSNDNADVQFIVRKDPTYVFGSKCRYLILLVNNSNIRTDVTLQIPKTLKFYERLSELVNQDFSAQFTKTTNNQLRIELNKYSGKAYVLTTEK